MDNKTLSIDGLVSNSSDLNKVSTDLNDICTELYSTINSLREGGQFVSITASASYFESIDSLNQMVPKFTEAILRFSKFLSDYVLQNYTEMDEEVKAKIESNMAESLSQLTTLGVIGSTGIDYGKIASDAQDALSGNFVSSDKVYKAAFEQEGSLEFVTRDDGSVLITKDGVPIGFTTQEGFAGAGGSSSVSSSNQGIGQTKADSYDNRIDASQLPPREVQQMGARANQGVGQTKADSYDNRIDASQLPPREVQQMDARANQGVGQTKADSYDSRINLNGSQQATSGTGQVRADLHDMRHTPREVQNMTAKAQNETISASIGTAGNGNTVSLDEISSQQQMQSNVDNLAKAFELPQQQNQPNADSLMQSFELPQKQNQSNVDSFLNRVDLPK